MEPSASVAVSSASASVPESLTAPTTLTNTLTSTDANGVLYTITQTIRNGNGGQSSAATGGSASFLENTGAVAGTFVAVGLVVTAGVMAFIVFMLKRRRRQRLDRDVAAAAAAAAASHHKGYDDDDESGPAMTQYGGYYSSNGMEVLDHPQPRMEYDYEDPAGGYDHYASDLTPGDRMSTATAAGMAGFGAQSAQQNYTQDDQQAYASHDQQQHYGSNDHTFNAVTSDDATNTAAQSSSNGHHRSSNGYYFDPNQAYDFATTDAPYGGQEEHTPPVPAHHRTGSEGSVSRGDAQDRGLKITNY